MVARLTDPPGQPDPLPVLVNGESGQARKLGEGLEEQLREAFARAGHAIAFRWVAGAAMAQAVQDTRGDTVVVGGGDGTIASAASALAGTRRRLAVLPLGTLNHFARAIGLDGTLEQAVSVAMGGRPLAVDVATAGDRIFLNNASLGLYARMVRNRERSALPKWLATIPAALRVLADPRSRDILLEVDGRSLQVRTPLLFVGNNRYRLDSGRLGDRESLTAGCLSLFAVSDRTPAGLVLTALRVLLGRFDPRRDFGALTEGREVIIDGRGEHHLALDGEIVALRFPLRLSVRPVALSVLVPEPAALGDSPLPQSV